MARRPSFPSNKRVSGRRSPFDKKKKKKNQQRPTFGNPSSSLSRNTQVFKPMTVDTNFHSDHREHREPEVHELAFHRNEKSIKQDTPKINEEKLTPIEKTKNKGKIIKNNGKPSIVNLPKLNITPKHAQTYYFANVYYTQPFGQLVYFAPGFSSFKICTYSNFVSPCEVSIVLPSTFTIESHLNYFDTHFDVCDA